jgi:hypothetical protein
MKKEIALPTTKPFRISASSFIIFVSTVFILLFGLTGLPKLFAVEKFANTMKEVKFMQPYANFVSYFIPLFEVFICVLLAFTFRTIGKTKIPTRKIGIYLSTLLMFELSVYVGAMLLMYGEKLPCGCGGVVEWLTWQQHFYLNVGLFLLGIAAIIVMKKNKFSSYY